MLGTDRILALDIGAAKVVLAEFSAKAGSLALANYVAVPLGADPDSDAGLPALVSATIRQAMHDGGIRPGPVLMSISGQIVFPRFIKLPPVARDKISQIVRLEAQSNVPFPIEEVVWDYQLIGTEQADLSALLVAVKTEMVERLTDSVEAAGLEPELVDASPIALYNAMRYNYPELPGCTMILDIGARTTNVIFAEGLRIFTRSIPVAGHAITKDLMKEFDLPFKDAEELKLKHAFVGFGGNYEEPGSGVASRVSKIARGVMTRLHAEVSRTINFYRGQQGGSQPALVLLAGGSSIIPHTDTFLRDKLKVDVAYLNPFRNVVVSDAVPAERIGQSVQVLGEVVGLALRRTLTCPVEINLLPPKLAGRKMFHRRLPFFGLSAAAMVLVMVVWGAYLARMQAITRERVTSVRQEVKKLQDVEGGLNQELTREKTVYDTLASFRALIAARTRWIEMLNDVQARLLPGMWLVSIEPRAPVEGGAPGLLLHCMAFTDKVRTESISEIPASLKKVRHFSDRIEIKNIKPVEHTDYMNEFLIDVDLAPDAAGGATP